MQKLEKTEGPNNYSLSLISLTLLFLFALARFVDLSADLPSYYDTGISVTDEGTYIDAPKKKVQTGEWNLAGEWWQSQKLTPLYALSLKNWLGVFGVSLISARALSAVLGVGILILSWLLGQRYYGQRGGLVLMTLVGSSFILTHFNRAAMVESMQLFFIWAGLWALSFSPSKKREFCVGVLVSATVLVKMSGAIAWPGIVLWYMCSQKIAKDPKRLFSLIAGGFAPFVLAEIVYPGFLLSSYVYSQENFGRLLNLAQAPKHLLHVTVRSMYLSREAPLLVLAFLGLLKVIHYRNKHCYQHLLWGFVFSLLLCCCIDMAVRRYLLYMPWLYLFAVVGVCEITDKKMDNKMSVLTSVALLLLTFLLLSGSLMFVGHFKWLPIKYIVSAATLISIAVVVWGVKNKFFVVLLSRWKKSYSYVCVLAAIVLGGAQHFNWMAAKTHYVAEVQQALSKRYTKGDVVYGNIAPMMTVESEAQGFFLFNSMGDPQKWNFSDRVDLITYVTPRYGYENGYITRFTQHYTRKTMIAGPWKMFAENEGVREVALFRLEK